MRHALTAVARLLYRRDDPPRAPPPPRASIPSTWSAAHVARGLLTDYCTSEVFYTLQ